MPAAGRTDDDPPRRTAPRIPFWVDLALLAGAVLFMLHLGWMRWSEVLVDYGRELYVPWRLSEGSVLYRDIAHLHGPFSPYWNAAVFRLFGTAIMHLRIVNFLIVVAILAMTHRLLARMAGRFAAAIGCLVLIFFFAFAHLEYVISYCYLAPYSHEMPHGLALSLAGLFALARYLERRKWLYLAAAGFAFGLECLTKVEFAVASGAALAGGVLLDGWARRDRAPATLQRLGVLVAGAVVPVAAAYLLLSTQMESPTALRGTLGAFARIGHPDLRRLKFYQEGAGLEDPIGNTGKMLAWAAAGLAGLALLAWGSRRLAGTGLASYLVAFLAGAALPLTAIAVRSNLVLDVARPLPVVTAGAIAGAILRLARRRDPAQTDGGRETLIAAFAIFSLAALAKILLNVRIYHYGFVLAMPAAMLAVAVALEWLPAWVARRGGRGLFLRAGALGFLVPLTGVYIWMSSVNFDQRQIPVGEGRDRFLANERGILVNRVLDRIDGLLPRDGTLVVMPEGVMLNYLSRRLNPTPYVVFMPVELMVFGEREMLAALQSSPPDCVVIFYRGVSEYGLQLFGKDHGLEIMAWLEEEYEVADRMDDESRLGDQFSRALILVRSDRSR